MILVVGATGQLGSLVVRRLRADGTPVRAAVRNPASAADLAATGAELVVADLGVPETLDAALEGVTAVVATANAVAPIRRGDSAAVVDTGYAELVRLPLRGEERTTLARAYPTLRRFRRLTGATIDRRGLMLVPGPASARQAFLSVHDASAGLAAAAVLPGSGEGPVDLGGPEVLSWTEVAAIFERVLDRRVRVVSQPAAVYAALARALAPVAPSLAGVVGLNRLIATSETDWDTTDTAQRLGLGPLRTVEEILRAKAALPPVR